MLDIPASEQKANWETCYPRVLLEKIESLGSAQDNGRRGVRHFLEWLANSKSVADVRVRTRFWRPQGENGVALFATDVEHARAFENTLCRWRDEFLSQENDLKTITRNGYIRAAVLSLRELAVNIHVDGIPKSINGAWARTKKIQGDSTPSLGAANLLGLHTADQITLTGYENERASLDAVRAAFVQEFCFWEALFHFGEYALSGAPPPEGVDPFARDELADYLREVSSARREGNFRQTDSASKRLQRAFPALCQGTAGARKFLADAANINAGERDIRLGTIVSGCFGPSRRCTLAAFGAALCDVGWNPQPLVDLPRNPFVFGGSRGTYIAGAEIIESFKRRAGHHVLAYIGQRTVNDGAQDSLERTLREVVPDFQMSGASDSYARLQGPSHDRETLLSILDRYNRIADALRDALGRNADKAVNDYFWIYSANGRATVLRDTNPHYNKIFDGHPLLSRPGVYPASIRKTYINLRKHETGSFDLTRAAAQHADSETLMPHYLNTPAMNADLDASIRQFQASVQAIAVRELDQERVALILGQESALLERMRCAANEAGIAHALGLYPDIPEDKAPVPRIEFIPSAENLLELHLVRRKLREMKISFNQDRFRREFLPLLALTVVIVRELLKKGCRPAYRAAVMRACAMLRNKEIALPALED